MLILPLNSPECWGTNEQIDWRAKQQSLCNGLRLGRSEVLRNLRHCLRAQAKPRTSHHRSAGGEGRGEMKRCLPWKDERGPKRQSPCHGLRLGRSEVLRYFRHCLRAQAKPRTSQHRSPAGEKKRCRTSSLKG